MISSNSLAFWMHMEIQAIKYYTHRKKTTYGKHDNDSFITTGKIISNRKSIKIA